jgi:NAD(P)-dependent dehydrogenase (short-subunit alcohol dehydrogenase family)
MKELEYICDMWYSFAARSLLQLNHLPMPQQATVEHMAQLPNFHIVMACRSVPRCETAKASIEKQHAKTQLSCLQLDLGSRASIEDFAVAVQYHLAGGGDETKQATEPIHALINNAGQMGNSETIEYIDEVETHIQVNHLGHFLLTHCLWKSLSAGKARIVNISSFAAMLPLNPSSDWHPPPSSPSPVWWTYTNNFLAHWIFYIRSKRANLMFTSELHHRFHNTTSGSNAITSVSSHPGYTRTPMLTRRFQFAPAGLRRFLFTNTVGSMAPSAGALTQVRAALDPHLASSVHVGPKYWTFGDAVPVGRASGWTTHHWPFSREESRLLWDQSVSTLGIGEFGVL